MEDRLDVTSEDPLGLVMGLLKLAKAVEPMPRREIDRRLRGLSGPKIDRPAWHLNRALKDASGDLRNLWNSLRRDTEGEPAWTTEWMPTFLHVDRWALSEAQREQCRVWAVEFLETLRDRLVLRTAQSLPDEQAVPPSGQGATNRPEESAAPEKPLPEWDELSDTSQRILEVLRDKTMLGKNIAASIDPLWTHDSIGKQLASLVKAGILKKVGKRSGYRIARLPPGAPFTLDDPAGAD